MNDVNQLGAEKVTLYWGDERLMKKHIPQIATVSMLQLDDIGKGYVVHNGEWMILVRSRHLIKINRQQPNNWLNYNEGSNAEFKEKHGFYKEQHYDHYYKFKECFENLRQIIL